MNRGRFLFIFIFLSSSLFWHVQAMNLPLCPSGLLSDTAIDAILEDDDEEGEARLCPRLQELQLGASLSEAMLFIYFFNKEWFKVKALLLAKCANNQQLVNQQDDYGRSMAWHLACSLDPESAEYRRFRDAMNQLRFIKRFRPNWDLPDNDGVTPRSLLQKINREDLIN